MQTLDPMSLPLQGVRFIEASAGTGKTWTLAALYVRLILAHGQAQDGHQPLLPPEILVVTFTRAATQEVRERIRRRLLEAAAYFQTATAPADAFLSALKTSFPTEQHAQCAQTLSLAADWMDQARITTIHAWCQQVLQEYALTSGQLEAFNITEEEDILYLEASRDYWRRYYYPLNPELAAWISQVFTDPEKLLKQAKPLISRHLVHIHYQGKAMPQVVDFEDIVNQQNCWLHNLETELTSVCRLFSQQHTEIQQLLTEKLPDLNLKFYQKWPKPFLDLQSILAQKNLFKGQDTHLKILKKFSASGIQVKKDKKVPQHPFFDAMDRLVAVLEANPQLDALFQLHAAYGIEQEFVKIKKHLNVKTFQDLIQELASLIQQPENQGLAYQLAQQYPAALIDEFQDTDALQYQIFKSIYFERPNTTCILIGDPKQAIYAFRNADIYTYLNARHAVADYAYTLGTNFRSAKNLVEGINQIFTRAQKYPQGAFKIASSQLGQGLDFHPVQAADTLYQWQYLDQAPPAPIHFWHLPSQGATCSLKHYQEVLAEYCAYQIYQLLSQSQDGKTYLQNSQNGDKKRIQAKDIAILVHDYKEAQKIRQALYQYHIKALYVSERQSIYNTQEAHQLRYWLRAIHEPYQEAYIKVALVSLLSNWHALQALQTDDLAWEQHLYAFRRYHKIWLKEGILPTLQALYQDYRLAERYLHKVQQGERALTNFLHLAELLQEASLEIETPWGLLQYLDMQIHQAQQARANSEHLLRLESDANLVQIVTLYKSKGLEYPFVFIPFACHKIKDKNQEVYFYHNTQGQLVGDFNTKTNEIAKQAAFEEHLQEQIRLLYVGMTRAIYGLFLGVANIAEKKNSISSILHQTAFGYLLAGTPHKAMTEADLTQSLHQLTTQNPHLFAHYQVPEQVPLEGKYQPENPNMQLKPAPLINHQARTPWWIASYSALVPVKDKDTLPDEVTEIAAYPLDEEALQALRHPNLPLLTQDGLAFADEDFQLDTEIETPINPQLIHYIHWFPRGPRQGTFLHEVLEAATKEGWAQMASQSPVRRQLVQWRCQSKGLEAWVPVLDAYLYQFARTYLPAPKHQQSLQDLQDIPLTHIQHWQTEMEFWLTCHQVRIQEIDAWATQALWPGHPRPRVQPVFLQGMFKGYIDLVFEHQGKYFIIDYKSNWLGQDASAYTHEALIQALMQHRYDLQYLFYTLALHRLLKSRHPHYDYDLHFGGVYYWFIRALDAPHQGLIYDKPPRDLIERLDAYFRA
ncbi:DNA helicase/exodeoxyribonuclease V, beta subunit [Allopseudospirillum japonicum]|uniref:RecBCD enzyme subunit RecB n=1 Tax=Allopseudospirillum japonicum TaxID=64971 RepID=A0A1H6Q0N1_9GAMM|nr:exodeoxyribonuclease V subunit beta [Allopseudospirillum japonicum]SEI37423.1 DNA helicase/exodeoxyribonuclease V, beta subunit [Allopseudospirillum japonicum]